MNPFNRRNFLKTTAAGAAVSGLVLPSTAGLAMQADQKKVKSVKGTETEKCLLKAFAGESQARNRYVFFADQARKEGFEQIAAIFEETAHHEQEHARRFFSYLEGGPLEIIATFPAGLVANTTENLKASAAGEHEEWAILYPEFAKIAQEEGFSVISKLFTSVCVSERFHERRYLDFLENVTEEMVFEREEEQTWFCRNCGYTSKNYMPPPICPACGKNKSQFQIFAKNY